jgi:hypothetical protein
MASVAVSLLAFGEGPLPKMTGGFGEKTCRTCHFDNPLNDKGGSLAIDGLPDRWTPGTEYTVGVTLKRPGLARYGFEMSARYAGGALKGRQAGAFRAEGDRLQIIFAPGDTVQYIQHTKAGSRFGTSGQGRWTFRWQAPDDATAGPIIFNVAANASNDDNSPLGDYIYAVERTAQAGPRHSRGVARPR